MDENKRQKLFEIDYTINPACGMCVHSKIDGGEDFGVCNKHEYKHLKHIGSPRKLSILRYGSCPDYTQAADYERYMHGFKEFVK